MKKSSHKNTVLKIIYTSVQKLKTTTDLSLCKDYILSLFFLRVISGLHDNRYEILTKQFDGNSTVVDEMMRAERIQIPGESIFSYLFAHREERGNGHRINQAFQLLEEANMHKFTDLFKHVNFEDNQLGNEEQTDKLLSQLLYNFEHIDISSILNETGKIFESIIQYFATISGKKSGEFYTPSEVSNLMAQLLEPQEADKIYDPCCGSASLLLEFAKEIRKNDKSSNRFAIFGQEISHSSCSMAKMNIFLHNLENYEIKWGDSIRHPRFLENNSSLKKFNIAVSHPPFSLMQWGSEVAEEDPFKRFKYGIPPKSKGDFAFILHMLNSIDHDNGKMAIVLPHGVLFRAGTEATIRQNLIEKNQLDAVIGLPEKLFYSTNIPTVLLIFKMNKKDSNVLFIDASNGAKSISRNQNSLQTKQIKSIVQCYKDRETVDNLSYLATSNQLKDNNFNCNIPLYVKVLTKTDKVDLGAIRHEQTDLLADLTVLNKQINELVDDLKTSI